MIYWAVMSASQPNSLSLVMATIFHYLCISAFLILASSCTPIINVLSPAEQRKALGSAPDARSDSSKEISQTLKSATRLQASDQRVSLANYLHALHLLDPLKNHSSWQKNAYKMALGNAVEIAQESELWGQPCSHNGNSYTIRLNKVASQISYIDQLDIASKYQSRSFTPPITIKGKGLAMTASYSWTPERGKKDVFLPHIGYRYPVNVSGKWATHSTLNISIQDPDHNTTLSSNYTAPFSVIEKDTFDLNRGGISGVFRPTKNDYSGLYSHEPLNPKKIPLILVHGLASSPTLWLDPMHQLIQNDKIRSHYQVYAYYYPTGLPIAYNAAILKKNISSLHRFLKQQGASERAERMVIIGHSMGGIISSLLTRDFTGTKNAFFKNTDTLNMNEKSKDALFTLFDDPPLHCISRAIFVAAPHRGSKLADNWYGQLASNLVKIPNSIVRTNSDEYLSNLSDLGRSILPSSDSLVVVKRLEYGNSGLMFILSREKVPTVKYHSIIGNRGRKGDITKSSDGVVPYSSSHLSNVASEVIVPTNHSAQGHPNSIEEMQRILLLNLN